LPRAVASGSEQTSASIKAIAGSATEAANVATDDIGKRIEAVERDTGVAAQSIVLTSQVIGRISAHQDRRCHRRGRHRPAGSAFGAAQGRRR
jgi:hypothetical protein